MLRVLVYALPVILAVYAVIDCIQTPRDETRLVPKITWLVGILLLPVLGPLAWLLIGRRGGAGRSGRRTGRAAGPRGGHSLAPDDDPEFLRQLRASDEEHERMLRQWERDLRRREGDDGPGSGSAGDRPNGTGRTGGTGGASEPGAPRTSGDEPPAEGPVPDRPSDTPDADAGPGETPR